MELPPEVTFHEDIHLFIYRPTGLVDEAAINKVIATVEELESQTLAPFDRLYDTSDARDVDLNFQFVTHASVYRRLARRGREPVKSAVVAKDSTLTHYGKLLELLTQGSSIKVRVFQNRTDAARWLGVPAERLM